MTGVALQQRPFSPSIAKNVSGIGVLDRPGFAPVAGPWQMAAGWAWNLALSLTASATFIPVSAAAQVPASASAVPSLSRPVAVRIGARAQVPAATQDMVATLKAKGMPIAALSDALGVERKTVYSWLDNGIEANPANYDRLQAVHGLLAEEADGSLRFFHRFWDRTLPNGTSLKAALTAPKIDASLVRPSLDALRPAVERAIRADAERKTSSSGSPASSLTLNLVVGT